MSYIVCKLPGTILIDNGAGYSAGVSTMHIDGFSDASGLLKSGSKFRMDGLSTEYTVSADAYIKDNEVDVSFTPVLAANVSDDDLTIWSNDIHDAVIRQFNLTYPYDYIEDVDNEINDLAEQRGVNTDDIETDPLHYKLKEYGIAYLGLRVCEDKMLINNVENTAELEKYSLRFNLYRERYNRLKPEITAAMMTGDVDEMRDRGSTRTSLLFRGG